MDECLNEVSYMKLNKIAKTLLNTNICIVYSEKNLVLLFINII